MKSFEVPQQYRSPLIAALKQQRKDQDRMKKDLSPTRIRIGTLEIVLARHFGFCYGVENAIEIAFRAVREQAGRRIFLLSEMIHNPAVNQDLTDLGVRFLMDTKGNRVFDWTTLTPEDVVIIPAFGTTLEIERELRAIGIEPATYETTCPFVEKVWNRADKIGSEGYTVLIHGKPEHEETRATFSHSRTAAPSLLLRDHRQAESLVGYISGQKDLGAFTAEFAGQYSPGFDPARDLQRIGVVNQTTMLATETQGIADYLRQVMIDTYGLEEGRVKERFADNRDTLCYATNDNQSAVRAMLDSGPADFALIIGGFNSSNTSHLVELCEERLPSYFIDREDRLGAQEVTYSNWRTHALERTPDYLPKGPATVMVTSGASCPDALVERVIARLAELTGNGAAYEGLLRELGG